MTSKVWWVCLEGLAFTAHSLEGIARLITAQQPTNKFVDVAVGWRTSANRLLVALVVRNFNYEFHRSPKIEDEKMEIIK
jgi:hypothetical protein